MKGSYLAVCILTIAVTVTSVHAQGQIKPGNPKKAMEFSLYSGFSMLTDPSPTKDIYEKSFNYGAGFGYAANNNNTLTVTSAYNKFSMDKQKYMHYNWNFQGELSGKGELSFFYFMYGDKYKLQFENKYVNTFFKANFGYMYQRFGKIKVTTSDTLGVHDLLTSYNIAHSVVTIYYDDPVSEYTYITWTMPVSTTNSLMFQIGLEADFKLTKQIYLFAEGLLSHSFNKFESTQFFPISFGLIYRRE